MTLYLSAETKMGIGYIPDWLKVVMEDGSVLTLDILGEIDYDSKTLDCRSKSHLIPWVLEDEEGEETDLSELSDEELMKEWPVEKIIDIISRSNDFRIGVYPCSQKGKISEEIFELAEKDSFKNCKASIFLHNGEKGCIKEFVPEIELNIY